jgi:hypothetical protein
VNISFTSANTIIAPPAPAASMNFFLAGDTKMVPVEFFLKVAGEPYLF